MTVPRDQFLEGTKRLLSGTLNLGLCDRCFNPMCAPVKVEVMEVKPNKLVCMVCAVYLQRKAA